MKDFTLNFFGFSDQGSVRPNNEDIWLFSTPLKFFVLADGMGGHNAGEVAATQAAMHLCEEAEIFHKNSLSKKDLMASIRASFQKVNHHIYALGKKIHEYRGMGTTLCCLLLHANRALIAHVGDSRIYRFRHARLRQLTRDHSLYNFFDKDDTFLPAKLPNKNVITRAIGTQPIVQPDVDSIKIQHDDLFLLCSDGLSDFVSSKEIKILLKKELSLPEKVKKLIEKAKDNGSCDNITVLLIQVKKNHEKTLPQQ